MPQCESCKFVCTKCKYFRFNRQKAVIRAIIISRSKNIKCTTNGCVSFSCEHTHTLTHSLAHCGYCDYAMGRRHDKNIYKSIECNLMEKKKTKLLLRLPRFPQKRFVFALISFAATVIVRSLLQTSLFCAEETIITLRWFDAFNYRHERVSLLQSALTPCTTAHSASCLRHEHLATARIDDMRRYNRDMQTSRKRLHFIFQHSICIHCTTNCGILQIEQKFILKSSIAFYVFFSRFHFMGHDFFR